MAVPFLPCMVLVASFYGLPPRVLPSIHVVEGGQVGTVHRNADGSEDLGVMQINTLWLPVLGGVAHMTPEAVRTRLVGDACFNIAAAGLVMRSALLARHGDLMTAIGDYHSHTPTLNASYQGLVRAAAARLFTPQAVAAAVPPARP